MDDNYSHSDNTVMYIDSSIPGSKENSQDYLELLHDFNSQIVGHCDCRNVCKTDVCECLNKTCDYNYIPYEGHGKMKYLLNYRDIDEFHPFVECNDMCLCTDQCGNRLVQNGPVEGLYVSPCKEIEKGLGLYTSSFLPKGSFVCEYAGELITKSQAIARHSFNVIKGKSNYIFCLNEYSNGKAIQTFVDPSQFGNIGRYINHSCDANCQVIPVRWNSPIPKLAIFTNVDVHPDNELTFNYGVNGNHAKKSKGLIKCLCKSQYCNNYMPFDDYS